MIDLRKQASEIIRFGGGRQKLLAASVFVLLLIALGSASLALRQPTVTAASNANTVILSYDHTTQTIPTQAKTVGELLSELNITINKGDIVEPSLTAKIDQDNFRVNIYRAQPVEIIDGSHKTFTFSAAASPQVIAEQAGITVYPEDKLTEGPVTNFALDGAIGEQIVIDRATPVNLMLYGHPSVVRTQAKTVGELVEDENIKLGSGDTLTPTADTPLTSGIEVAIAHQGVTYTTTTTTIAAPVSYITDATLTAGTDAIRQAGSAGESETTYEVVTVNGVQVSQTAIQQITTVQPVEEIIAVGTAEDGSASAVQQEWMNAAGISPGDQTYASYIISHESGWCATKAQGEHYCP
ncbi:MAG: ubiquitin-like domain-containing protein, partial [Candidatus Saccharimonadales bacterium]